MHLHERFLSYYLGQVGEYDLEKVTGIMHRLFEVYTRQVDTTSLNVGFFFLSLGIFCSIYAMLMYLILCIYKFISISSGMCCWYDNLVDFEASRPPTFKEHVILMIGS